MCACVGACLARLLNGVRFASGLHLCAPFILNYINKIQSLLLLLLLLSPPSSLPSLFNNSCQTFRLKCRIFTWNIWNFHLKCFSCWKTYETAIFHFNFIRIPCDAVRCHHQNANRPQALAKFLPFFLSLRLSLSFEQSSANFSSHSQWYTAQPAIQQFQLFFSLSLFLLHKRTPYDGTNCQCEKQEIEHRKKQTFCSKANKHREIERKREEKRSMSNGSSLYYLIQMLRLINARLYSRMSLITFDLH